MRGAEWPQGPRPVLSLQPCQGVQGGHGAQGWDGHRGHGWQWGISYHCSPSSRCPPKLWDKLKWHETQSWAALCPPAKAQSSGLRVGCGACTAFPTLQHLLLPSRCSGPCGTWVTRMLSPLQSLSSPLAPFEGQ